MSYNSKLISVHHIGGRGGNRSFPVLKSFEKDIINVLYDADSDCIKQIQQKALGLESKLYVLPYCLYSSCKQVVFNINCDPHASSLYDLNPDYKSKYYPASDSYGEDYILSETCKTLEKRSIEAVTLDHIFSQKCAFPKPDFLSIDTQGSEYEILQGAENTIQSNTVAIITEAEFIPLYKGQKLYGDLARLLSQQGFEFARFLDIGVGEMADFRAPLGLRGEGFHTFSDVLFVRRIDDINTIADKAKCYIMFRKLAFIAIVYNFLEYGLECLRQSKEMVDNHTNRIQSVQPLYLKFLSDLEEAIERMPTLYPNTFALKYSFTESKSRLENKEYRRGLTKRTKQFLKKFPVLYLSLRYIKNAPRIITLKVNYYFRLITAGLSPVEVTLNRYGLKKQAGIIRHKRIIQTPILNKNFK